MGKFVARSELITGLMVSDEYRDGQIVETAVNKIEARFKDDKRFKLFKDNFSRTPVKEDLRMRLVNLWILEGLPIYKNEDGEVAAWTTHQLGQAWRSPLYVRRSELVDFLQQRHRPRNSFTPAGYGTTGHPAGIRLRDSTRYR